MLLIVDDDEVYRSQLQRSLERRGLDVLAAANGLEALGMLIEHPIKQVVLDLRMPGPTGLNVLESMLERRPELEVVMVTGWGSVATAVEAVKLGAKNYLPKPATASQILAAFDESAEEDLGDKQLESATRPMSLARAEWEHIQQVLRETENNISEAARRLNVPRRTLQRKLQKYPPLS